jgi:hypothetical protein
VCKNESVGENDVIEENRMDEILNAICPPADPNFRPIKLASFYELRQKLANLYRITSVGHVFIEIS